MADRTLTPAERESVLADPGAALGPVKFWDYSSGTAVAAVRPANRAERRAYRIGALIGTARARRLAAIAAVRAIAELPAVRAAADRAGIGELVRNALQSAAERFGDDRDAGAVAAGTALQRAVRDVLTRRLDGAGRRNVRPGDFADNLLAAVRDAGGETGFIPSTDQFGRGIDYAVRAARLAGVEPSGTEARDNVLRAFADRVPLDDRYATGTVRALCAAAYNGDNAAALPILADALADAGCPDEPLLGALRSGVPAARGVAIVDRYGGPVRTNPADYVPEPFAGAGFVGGRGWLSGPVRTDDRTQIRIYRPGADWRNRELPRSKRTRVTVEARVFPPNGIGSPIAVYGPADPETVLAQLRAAGLIPPA